MQTVTGHGSSAPHDRPVTAGAPGDRHGAPAWLSGACYVALFLLGALEALVGSFQYSRALGSFPAAAIGFALLIGLTCVLGAYGMRRPLGGTLPGAGWVLTAIVLAMGTPGGSVLITNSAAGQWFLYGGIVCVIAVCLSFLFRPARRRS